MTFGVMQKLEVHICKDAQDSIDRGHIYRDGIKAIEIDKVVVVRNGTKGNNSTVDIVLKDQQGNTFVVMVTGALLKSIPC
jgi:RNA:NAD 2'-phosphotransferase (TPT1/KptA family)